VTPAERFATARVARLATVAPDDTPHLVPIVFAMTHESPTGDAPTGDAPTGYLLHSAVDGKPKRTRALRRLANIAANPRVSVLADHYDDDWSLLWWVRADGVCRIRDTSPDGLAALVARYPQYRQAAPAGPFLEITVERWSAWTASP
jgi:PPOX class probable F420-dependent enzyme